MGGVDNNTNLYCPNWGYCLSEVAFSFFLCSYNFTIYPSNFSIHPNIESIKGGLFSDFVFLAQSTVLNKINVCHFFGGQQHLIYFETNQKTNKIVHL